MISTVYEHIGMSITIMGIKNTALEMMSFWEIFNLE
jgi:hypothetical protein